MPRQHVHLLQIAFNAGTVLGYFERAGFKGLTVDTPFGYEAPKLKKFITALVLFKEIPQLVVHAHILMLLCTSYFYAHYRNVSAIQQHPYREGYSKTVKITGMGRKDMPSFINAMILIDTVHKGGRKNCTVTFVYVLL